jgi:hypothetical protein
LMKATNWQPRSARSLALIWNRRRRKTASAATRSKPDPNEAALLQPPGHPLGRLFLVWEASSSRNSPDQSASARHNP